MFKPGFHLRQTPRPRHKKQSDYVLEQSSLPLIALFWLKIGRCRGRNWLNGTRLKEPPNFLCRNGMSEDCDNAELFFTSGSGEQKTWPGSASTHLRWNSTEATRGRVNKT